MLSVGRTGGLTGQQTVTFGSTLIKKGLYYKLSAKPLKTAVIFKKFI
jgi:hypothetical protein